MAQQENIDKLYFHQGKIISTFESQTYILPNETKIFHQPFEWLGYLFGILNNQVERPMELVRMANGTRSNGQCNPFLTRSVAIYFTCLMESH